MTRWHLRSRWRVRRLRRLTRPLIRRLGFTAPELQSADQRQLAALRAWLAPSHAWQAGAFFALMSSPWLVTGTYNLVDATYRATPGASKLAANSMFWPLASLSLVLVWQIAGIAWATLTERWGDGDRALGLACRRILRQSTSPAKSHLVHRRILLRNTAALKARADRVYIDAAVSDAIVDTAKQDGPLAPQVRALLLNHLQGKNLDADRFMEPRQILQGPSEGWANWNVKFLGVLAVLASITSAIAGLIKVLH
jgi:hypothetical protein